MAPKSHKIGRLRQLQTFVCDPVKLQELRGRSGDSLKAKLRQRVPGELTWQQFVHRTRFDANEQCILDELNNLVTCKDDSLIGTSHGGASTTANTVDGAHARLASLPGSDGESRVEAHVSSTVFAVVEAPP